MIRQETVSDLFLIIQSSSSKLLNVSTLDDLTMFSQCGVAGMGRQVRGKHG